jgi:hypothetical protein
MNKKSFKRARPMKYSITIGVPPYDSNYPGYSKPMEWCKTSCRGGWQYNQNGEFLFEKESDLALFAHTWKK